VYCGTSWRSALAAKSLKDLGFTNVRAVDMRMADWLAAGYPVEKSTQ
jgi:rhodanese-related sulfurtransferase